MCLWNYLKVKSSWSLLNALDGNHFALHVNHPKFDPDYLKFVRFNIEELNNAN